MSDFKSMWSAATPAETSNQEFKVLDVGEYEANVEQVSYDASKNRLTIEFNIEKFLTDPTQNVSRRKSWASYTLEEKGVSFLKKDLTKLNLSIGEPDSAFQLSDQLHQKLAGKRVKLFINQREYNGKTYNNTYINGALTAPRNHAPTTQAEAKARMTGSPPQIDQDEQIPF